MLRILLLALTISILVWLVLTTTLYATIAILFLVCAGQVWALIYFVEQTNRHVVRFLESVKYGDTVNMGVSGHLGSSFQELVDAFGSVVQDFERIRREKEEQYLALQTILHHVSIGLLSFDNDGIIDFMNPAARRLLGITHIRSLNQLGISYKPLITAFSNLADDGKTLVKLVVNDEILQLALGSTRFRQQGRELTLISLQNIVSELEEQEIVAWQKLIRVLTHEIMNSVAPITSLAQTVSVLLEDDLPTESSELHEFIGDIRSAIGTIARRSEGLLSFVENYRKLSRIPEPDFSVVRLDELFQRVERLLASQLSAAAIKWTQIIDPIDMSVIGDATLLEQVCINLVQNAIHAIIAHTTAASPQISITARQTPTGRITIDIQDTGTGILPEALDKIFVPFFTTKPDGSGIGLSFARQVLRKHGASLTVSSELGAGTTFHIRF
jgi:nitrogen fixation/metabolism regulation signal transduction histidine kinase